ncbi:MAG: oligosaccharide flippase family protein [Proteobacteria bacterium]|nr:oligosaccharide flippase family protein [Pseudomonadota bacterium]
MTQRKKESDLVKTTGRGVIYITFAKGWFMLTGWALIFGLPRIFKWASGGDIEQGQALFGAYKIVFMGVSFINNGIITGTIQAVSKFTSEDEANHGSVRKTALKVQGLLGIALAVLYIGFAGLVADLLGSPDLALLMRITAGIIVAYSCYAVFIGSFNGRRMFSRQALFDIAYATIKTVLIVGLAALGFEVLGTVLGFLIAAIVIAIAAAIVSGGTAGNTGFPIKRYLAFASVLIIYTFILNLVMSLDLFLLKAFSSQSAIAAGHTPEVASALSKAMAGQYGAAQGLAFIPYQAILSIAFVAFPMISKVTFADDKEKSKTYVRKTLRFTTILIVGLAAVFAALPSQSLGLIFPAEYRVASHALGILSFGIAAFGLMVVSNTILNGAGLPFRAMAAVAIALLAVIGAVWLFLRTANPGPDTLTATAVGTATGMAIGLVVSAVIVYQRFGTFWPWATAFRVAIAGAVAVTIGRLFLPNAGKIITLGECVLVLVIYLVVLIATLEFRKEDLRQLKQILKRG